MSAVVDVLMRGVRKQVNNVMEFLTTPKGPFEFVDEVVRDARSTARELVQTVTGKVGVKILRR